MGQRDDTFPKREAIDPEASWELGVVDDDGKPMVVRVCTDRAPLAGHPELPWQVGVATLLNEPLPNGMHGDAEGEQLGAIEDALENAFGADAMAFMVLVNCVGGAKEWVFYAHDPEVIKKRFQALRPGIKTHKVQLMVEHDPDWEVFRSFLPDE